MYKYCSFLVNYATLLLRQSASCLYSGDAPFLTLLGPLGWDSWCTWSYWTNGLKVVDFGFDDGDEFKQQQIQIYFMSCCAEGCWAHLMWNRQTSLHWRLKITGVDELKLEEQNWMSWFSQVVFITFYRLVPSSDKRCVGKDARVYCKGSIPSL